MLGLLAIVCLTLALSARGGDPDLRLLPPVEDERVRGTVLTAAGRPWEDLTDDVTSEPGGVDGFSIWEEVHLAGLVDADALEHTATHGTTALKWASMDRKAIPRRLTLRTGANLRKKDWSDLKVALNYVKASADYVETKHNAQLEVHHDWLLGESRWSPYAKSIFVYDEFRPYRCELTLNAGIGYRFIKTENTTLTGRFGSGASRKFRGSDNTWEPEAMFGVDFEHKISERQKFRVTVEYYPEWGDFALYRIRTDAAWEVLLDEDTNMSLKLGVIDRYDTRDSGQEPNALDYTLLLLWKL